MLKIAIASLIVSSLANADIVSFALVADAGRLNEDAADVRDSIARSGVTNLVMAGDNIYDTSKTYQEIWRSWKEAGLSFDITALGNHTRGYQEEIEYFKMPAENFSVTRHPGTRFIVLNSDNKETVPQQIAWLTAELEAAREAAVFLVFHHPTYTISTRHRWTEKRKFQESIRPLLRQYRDKITALILGHDHLATLVHFEDLPAIVSGATQDPKRDQSVNYSEGLVRVRTAWLDSSKEPFWARMDVDSESGETEVHFIAAEEDRLACSASLSRGSAAKLKPNCGTS